MLAIVSFFGSDGYDIAAKEEELAKVQADLDEAMTGDVELKLSRKAERLLKEIQNLKAYCSRKSAV